jgi:hypothetical protein
MIDYDELSKIFTINKPIKVPFNVKKMPNLFFESNTRPQPTTFLCALHTGWMDRHGHTN